jgi:phosphatidylethanolamine/phosphatidyl-N-methylethanolamine N-methyltransferase
VDFLKETIKYPKHVGALSPSSLNLAELIVEKAKLNQARNIIELGPGTGVFTEHILKRMNRKANFFAIEVNKTFISLINKKYPSINVYHGLAVNICKYMEREGMSKADRIISGLPWASFSKEAQEENLSKIVLALKSGGLFLTFAYFPINHGQSGRQFKRLLLKHFDSVSETDIVLNLPPAFVYICRK